MTSTTSTTSTPEATSSPEDKGIVAEVQAAAKAWNAGVETQNQRMRRCAAATDAAFEAGLIGKGKVLGTQADYASKFVSPTGGSVSQATITMWRRYGKAARLGADDKTLSRLVQVYGDKRVGPAVDKATSKTAILKAVNAVFGRDGKRIAPTKPATDDTATPDNGEGSDASIPAVGRNNSTRLDSLETVLAALEFPLSPKEAKRFGEFAERVAFLLDSGQVAQAS